MVRGFPSPAFNCERATYGWQTLATLYHRCNFCGSVNVGLLERIKLLCPGWRKSSIWFVRCKFDRQLERVEIFTNIVKSIEFRKSNMVLRLCEMKTRICCFGYWWSTKQSHWRTGLYGRRNVRVSAIQVDILWVLQDTSVEQFSFRYFGSNPTTKGHEKPDRLAISSTAPLPHQLDFFQLLGRAYTDPTDMSPASLDS